MGRRSASMSPTSINGGGIAGGHSTLIHAHQQSVSTLERSAIKSKTTGSSGGGGGGGASSGSSSSSSAKKNKVGDLSPTGLAKDPKSFV